MSTLRDFKYFYYDFSVRQIQIRTNWFSGPPEKLKVKNHMSILRVLNNFSIV